MGRNRRPPKFSSDYQKYLKQRNFWRKEIAVKRNRRSAPSVWHKHHEGCDCVDDQSLLPVDHLQQMRRLRGPTISTATDGLTYEETCLIDISEFEVECRWKAYIADMPDGTKTVLYRLRPKHHDQRSGGTDHLVQEGPSPGNVHFVMRTIAKQQHCFTIGCANQPGPSGIQSQAPSTLVCPNDADNEDSDNEMVLITEPEDTVVNNGDSTSTLPMEVHVQAKKHVSCAITSD